MDHPYLTEGEKQKFLDIMLDWACFYETVAWGEAHKSAIREKIGIMQHDFQELVDLHRSESVFECIKKAWTFGGRALTSKEICAILGNKFSETNIRKQIQKLSRHGYIKSKSVKILGKVVDFYYISKQLND